MDLRQLTAPDASDEPISVSEACDYLLLDTGDQDTSVAAMIAAATRLAEASNGRYLARRTFELALDIFPGGSSIVPTGPVVPYNYSPKGAAIKLPVPLVSISAFTYKQLDGTTVTMVADTDYILNTAKEPAEVIPAAGKFWPSVDLWPASPIRIQFTAGMLPAEVPGSIKQGIKLLVSQWFENRIPFEAIRFAAELPYSVRYLFEADRLYWL